MISPLLACNLLKLPMPSSPSLALFFPQVFAELFDPVIDERHDGYPNTAKHPTDLDASKLQHGHLDGKYVLSSRVRTGRSIRGFSLPPACTRAERREVEKVRGKHTSCIQLFQSVQGSLCANLLICELHNPNLQITFIICGNNKLLSIRTAKMAG